jgi:hypothetical protein
LVLLLVGASARNAELTVLHYTARLHGVPLLDVTLCLEWTDATYQAGISARTLGLAEILAHARATGHVEGVVAGNRVIPKTYAEHSRLSGEDYAIAIDYPAGVPVLRSAIPPQEKYRLPVPQADLPGAIDGLSAVTLESLIASRTGACEGRAVVYDGRQLRSTTTSAAGTEALAPNPRSIFAGPALRCDTVSTMRAGYLKDHAIEPQAKPHRSTAWLAAALPGGPKIPVRVLFDADFIGDIIVDLDAANHTPSPACG